MLNRRRFLVPVLFVLISSPGALAAVEAPHPAICGKPLKLTRGKNSVAIELEGEKGPVTVSANVADADRSEVDGLASEFDSAKDLYLQFCLQDDPSAKLGKRFAAGPNAAEASEALVSR